MCISILEVGGKPTQGDEPISYEIGELWGPCSQWFEPAASTNLADDFRRITRNYGPVYNRNSFGNMVHQYKHFGSISTISPVIFNSFPMILQPNMHEHTHHEVPKRVALTSISIDIVIFGIKLWIGLAVGSLALLSDAFHTLSDSLSSGVVYVGLKISEKPADESHPFGHGRADQLALLVVGILLVMVAVKFMSDGALALIVGPETISMKKAFFAIIIITAVVKEVMGEISYYVGRRENVESLKADAWHHRSDALTTFLVLAAIYGSQIGFPQLDPVMGMVIAVILGYIGTSYLRKAANKLLGTAPSKELLKDIKRKSTAVEGVRDVHGIKVHDYGDSMAISLHMDPEPGTLKEAHRVTHLLTDILEQKYSASVDVHLDPWEMPEKELTAIVTETVNKRRDVKNAHRISISEGDEGILLSFHVVLPRQKDVSQAHDIASSLETEIETVLKRKLGIPISVPVHIEPCDTDCDLCEISE